jgi:hypothetical protein
MVGPATAAVTPSPGRVHADDERVRLVCGVQPVVLGLGDRQDGPCRAFLGSEYEEVTFVHLPESRSVVVNGT